MARPTGALGRRPFCSKTWMLSSVATTTDHELEIIQSWLSQTLPWKHLWRVNFNITFTKHQRLHSVSQDQTDSGPNAFSPQTNANNTFAHSLLGDLTWQWLCQQGCESRCSLASLVHYSGWLSPDLLHAWYLAMESYVNLNYSAALVFVKYYNNL